MSDKVVINKQEVQFSTKDNQVFCTSLDVARVFGKRHDHVLRDIENILNDLREIGTSKVLSNFGETYRNTKIRGFGKVEGKTRKDRCYNLTRDGFSLLAMGFTGKKALQWKMLFINAFNEMENIARNRNSNTYLNEIAETISKILPTHNFKVSFEIHDQDKNQKHYFSYEVGDAKFKKHYEDTKK
ncbi:phage regulatory protein [Campylobacter lari]|uniref:Phage regulatory protein n=1 Tax=Campylobacter lari TaxID=201 RepID=A0A7U8ARK2_CAMLA|nr:phage regulatory protein [Campylobacter lari]